MSIQYYRTFDLDGSQATHLCTYGDDKSICGQDTAGDPDIYRKEPELVAPPARVTCPHCQAIIDACMEHRGKSALKANQEGRR